MFSIDNIGGFKNSSITSSVSGTRSDLNSYARVTAISDTTITIADISESELDNLCKFRIGNEIILHVSASRNGATQYLGKWCWAKITAVSNNLLTLNRDVTKTLPASELANYYVQAIVICPILNETFDSDCVFSPPVFSTSTFTGGIIVIKCHNKFIFKGGKIDLTDKGIPVASKAIRPLLKQELQGTLNTDKYSGWENGVTADRFLLNAGDGACMLLAKKFQFNNTNSRIGNIDSRGMINCRASTDTEVKPPNATNIGGSTILLATSTGCSISRYNRQVIFSKYRNKTLAEGQGLARAYFATPGMSGDFDDQGCVSLDNIDSPNRLANKFNIHDFGNGSSGTVKNPDKCINNYARILSMSEDRKSLTVTKITTDGLEQIKKRYACDDSRHVDFG